MRVQVTVPSVVGPVPTDEAEGGTDRHTIPEGCRGISAGMDQSAHEVAGDLRGAVTGRPDGVEKPASHVEVTKVGQGADVDTGPLLGPGEIALG